MWFRKMICNLFGHDYIELQATSPCNPWGPIAINDQKWHGHFFKCSRCNHVIDYEVFSLVQLYYYIAQDCVIHFPACGLAVQENVFLFIIISRCSEIMINSYSYLVRDNFSEKLSRDSIGSWKSRALPRSACQHSPMQTIHPSKSRHQSQPGKNTGFPGGKPAPLPAALRGNSPCISP